MKIGAVILVGGKSRRMGADKAALTYEGQSFLERITKELGCFDEIVLSVGDNRKYKEFGLPVVKDIYPGCGPLGGLHAALCACKSDALFCIACDMPLFKMSLAEHICSKAEENFDAIVPVSMDGRIHPLCAVYKKTAAYVFAKQILSNDYKIIDAYERMKVLYVPLEETDRADTYLFNVNTPEEYKALSERTANYSVSKSTK